MSTSLRPLCCECSRSISNARSALVDWRAIKIPFACSMTARRLNALQVVVLAEALQGDVDRDRQLVGIIVEDVREDPALRGFVHVRRIFADKSAITGQEASHDLADQVQGVFRGRPSPTRATSGRSRGHDSDLLDVDLARDHVVPRSATTCASSSRRSRLVRDQDPETLRLTDRACLLPRAAPVFHRPKIMVARFCGNGRLPFSPPKPTAR